MQHFETNQRNSVLNILLSKLPVWKRQQGALEEASREARVSLQAYTDLSDDVRQMVDANHFNKSLRYEREL